MEIKGRFDHFNFNVLDLEKSIRFYEKALGLKEVRRKTASDGSFILVYMGDGETSFTLELTWLRDRKEPYDLGEGEYHLCLRVPGDYDKVRAFHKEMDVYATKIPTWASILSAIPMDIGSKYYLYRYIETEHTSPGFPKIR